MEFPTENDMLKYLLNVAEELLLNGYPNEVLKKYFSLKEISIQKTLKTASDFMNKSRNSEMFFVLCDFFMNYFKELTYFLNNSDNQKIKIMKKISFLHSETDFKIEFSKLVEIIEEYEGTLENKLRNFLSNQIKMQNQIDFFSSQVKKKYYIKI